MTVRDGLGYGSRWQVSIVQSGWKTNNRGKLTALFSLFGFARSGLVEWRPAILLAIVTTLAAPLGARLAQNLGARRL